MQEAQGPLLGDPVELTEDGITSPQPARSAPRTALTSVIRDPGHRAAHTDAPLLPRLVGKFGAVAAAQLCRRI